MSLVNVPVARRNAQSLAQKVAAILRKYGTDAHVYLPGIGVINGLTAGNYLDSAGTTAATVDNPVGLVLDAAGSVSATELAKPISSATGWSGINANVASDGTSIIATATVSGANAVQAYFDVTTVIGSTYKLSELVSSHNAASAIALRVRAMTTAFVLIAEDTLTGVPQLGDLYFIATATTTRIVVRLDATFTSGVTTMTIGSASVKEVTGIHATQATTANKPILRRGAVNLIIRSQEFNIGSWTKNNVAAVDGIVAAPIGTSQASTLTTIAGTNAHTITSSAISCPSGAAISIYAKANTHSLVQLFIGGTATPYANFNLANGTASGFGAGTTASIENAGDGWYRCILKTTNTAASSFQFGLVTNISSARAESWNAVGTESVYIFGAQAENGSTVSPYIPTTTAPASSSTGNYHWVHDSTDLLTATFPAGYESATTINAATTGQTTLTAQNIVGAYNIGPSIDTYGRFVFRTGLTASELATIQSYCNRLAGV